MTLTDALNFRYAVKKFDPSRKLSDTDLNDLLESLRLAPSSYGLQPWKFVVVNDDKLRLKLREASWNQSQVTDASHLLVLCARTDVDESYVKKYVEQISKVRSIPVSNLDGYRDMMLESIKSLNQKKMVNWNSKQVYLALGFLLLSAAFKKIDACPMEGFDSKKVDRILKLKKANLTSVVLCPVGYRSTDDSYAKLNKVRFDKSEVIIEK